MIETDPRFTDRGLWLGSDFLLNQLGTDGATTIARLGDGFYEQQLVRGSRQPVKPSRVSELSRCKK